MPPQASVVIPVYNRADLIRRAIDSVLNQRGSEVELIVIDDGSTDDTAKVLDSYGEEIAAVHQANAGRSAARNAGLVRASAPLVAFLDSDDAFHETKIARQVAWHEEHPDVGLSAHGIRISHRDGRVEDQPPRCDVEALATHPYETVLDGFAFFPSVIMVKRELAQKVGGFSADYDGAEDLDFALKIALEAPLGVMPDCLTTMFQHAGQTARKQLARENVRVLRRHLEERELTDELRAILKRKIARYLISVAKRAEDREELRALLSEAAELDPSCRFRGAYLKLKLKAL